MTEYQLNLSTTSPNNVGLIQVRQHDEETQVLGVQIFEDGKPKDITGLTPFFCVKNGPTMGLGLSEQKVSDVVDAKNGKLKYTLVNYDMQHIGVNRAYFSFRKLNEKLEWRQQFSTRDFPYTVKPSIFSDGIKDSNYIWTFEEILRYYLEWVNESMKIYDDWYILAQEELQRIISEFQVWIHENQELYETWTTENKANYLRWMEASKLSFEEWFDSIRNILDENVAGNLQNQLDEFLPTKELIQFTHDFKGYPDVKVLYWEYGLATVSLGDEPTGVGGGNVHTVNSQVEYLDPFNLKVKIPVQFNLINPSVELINENTVRLISGYKTIEINVKNCKINVGTEVLK